MATQGSTLLQKLFQATGLKRKVATYLTAIMAVITQYPDLQIVLPLLQYIAGFFGITGIVHAAGKDTISQFKLASLISLLAVLIAATAAIPSLAPFLPVLQKIALVLAPFSAGYTLAKPAKKK